MADSTLTMDRLRQMAPELQALTQAHGGSNLRVFGSVLQGKAGPGSDLDVLVAVRTSHTCTGRSRCHVRARTGHALHKQHAWLCQIASTESILAQVKCISASSCRESATCSVESP
jgi:predicted nucleotidyltransferase